MGRNPVAMVDGATDVPLVFEPEALADAIEKGAAAQRRELDL